MIHNKKKITHAKDNKPMGELPMKKIILILVSLAIIAASAIMPGIVSAAESGEISVKAKSAYCMEFETGTAIYQYKEKERLPIASMCKIMSLLLAFERIDAGQMNLDDQITVSETAAHMGGSQAFLDANRSYLCSDLIKSIIVASANDSTVAIAETISGSEDLFVDQMNRRAKELGMENTNFTNCTGLPKPGQYSCAHDVAVMTRELMNHKGYFEFSNIWMDKLIHNENRFTELTNTNKLIRFYRGCDGGKTGYTSEAGHCISATAQRDGLRFISVVIGEPDSQTRFEDTKKLFNYGFANFKATSLVEKDQVLPQKATVVGGKADELELIAEANYVAFEKKDEQGKYLVEYDLPQSVKAPVKKGDCVGKLLIIKDNVIVDEVNLIANEDVQAAGFADSLNDVIDNWLLG